MGFSLKLVLNRPGRKNSTGLYSIYFRVIINRDTRYFNLEKKIESYYWQDKQDNWIKPTYRFHRELNDILRKKYDDLRQFVYNLETLDHAITFDVIEEFLEKKNGNSKLFNDYAEDIVTRKLSKECDPNTYKKHKTFLGFLNEYQTITFSQVNHDMIVNFSLWLNREKKLVGSTILKYLASFRQIASRATEEGYFKINPFNNLKKLPFSADRVNDPDLLSLNDIRKIKMTEIPDHMPAVHRARLDFLFCFYSGCRLYDLSKLTWDDIKDSDYGQYILGNRAKNQKQFVSPIFLFPHAIEILKIQRGQDPIFVFPHLYQEDKNLFQQNTLTLHNRKLKALAILCGLRPFANSAGRHSLLDLYANEGFPLQFVSAIAGHTRMNTTLAYFKLKETAINKKASEFKFDL